MRLLLACLLVGGALAGKTNYLLNFYCKKPFILPGRLQTVCAAYILNFILPLFIASEVESSFDL